MNSNISRKNKLEDICKKITDGSHYSPKSVNNGYPMASVKDLTYFDINIDQCRRITEKEYQKLVNSDCKPLINDVLVAKDGSYLKNIIIIKEERDIVVLSSIAILRPDLEKVNPLYLKYYLLNPNSKRRIKQGYASGSALPRITLKDLKQFKVDLKPIPEQDKIASILSSIDDKIELNNQINKNLEELAQTIFQHWFVDFEFPGKNGEPYKSSGGEMIESELGQIPKGWEVLSLTKVADFLNGLAMQKYPPENIENSDLCLPVLKIKELKNGKTTNESDKCSIRIDSKYIVNNGDIIFSWSGSLEVKIWCGDKAGLNQHLFKVTSESYPKWFYYFWVKYHIEEFRRIAKDKTTTMGHIRRQDLNNAKVLDPGNDFLDKYGKIINDLLDLYINNEEEVKLLTKLRDVLLPKLMSGEIRVPIENLEKDN
jgi:type I restriction enzyme S subunit